MSLDKLIRTFPVIWGEGGGVSYIEPAFPPPSKKISLYINKQILLVEFSVVQPFCPSLAMDGWITWSPCHACPPFFSIMTALYEPTHKITIQGLINPLRWISSSRIWKSIPYLLICESITCVIVQINSQVRKITSGLRMKFYRPVQVRTTFYKQNHEEKTSYCNYLKKKG